MYSKRDGTGGPFEPGPLKVSSTGRVTEAMAHLGPRALQILADIAERLAKGAEQYRNDLDDGRDWVQETFEELADGLVYASVKLLEVREAKAADEARNRAARRLSDELQQRANQIMGQQAYTIGGITQAMRREPSPVAGSRTVRESPSQGLTAEYGQNREPLGPDFYKHYGPPTERDGVWAECSKPGKHPAVEAMYQKHGALVCECSVCKPPVREEWEKTRDGCG